MIIYGFSRGYVPLDSEGNLIPHSSAYYLLLSASELNF